MITAPDAASPVSYIDSVPPRSDTPAPEAGAESGWRFIVQSSPVGLVLVDPDGKVLAANRCALNAVGAERLDQFVGHPFDRFAAPEDRARVAGFVTDVCSGASGSLEYDLIDENGTRRAVETRAVPLRREGTELGLFLGATWEITGPKRPAGSDTSNCAPFAEERQALQQALRDAQQAAEATARNRDAERRMLGTAIREHRHRMQRALAEAEEQHHEREREWLQERGTLLEKLKAVEMRIAALETDMATLIQKSARNEEQLTDSRTSRVSLEGSVRELEVRCSRLAEDQARWLRRMSEVTRLLQETAARAEGLLAASDQADSGSAVTVRAANGQIPDSDSGAASTGLNGPSEPAVLNNWYSPEPTHA